MDGFRISHVEEALGLLGGLGLGVLLVGGYLHRYRVLCHLRGFSRPLVTRLTYFFNVTTGYMALAFWMCIDKPLSPL